MPGKKTESSTQTEMDTTPVNPPPKKKRKRKTKTAVAKTEPTAVTKSEPETSEISEISEISETKTTPEEVTSKKKRRRNFRLYGFNPENGRAPKNGGYYSASSPQLAAKKSANRWVCDKNVYDKVCTFRMREVTSGSAKSIYEFKAKRVKLDKPKTYKRGDKEITVNSKIVIIA